MASGDNVDVIEVVETSFTSPSQATEDHLKPEQSADEDNKSTGDKVTAFDISVNQHGTAGLKTPVGVSRNKSERERKIGHRRVGVGGEITYKKIQTTQIMGSIQLGIQHAVGGLASKPERDLLMQDFMTVETTNFPSEGSNHTPAHHFSEFKFKNYAPIAFRYFRDLFGIQPDDFLMSMCSAPLRELSNPGASGSIFYLTDDDEFIIKTVQHKEGEFLQTLLPGYYMNLNQNPRTLLPKFFGLYCYRCNSKNVRLVAMNNLLPSSVKLHQKYDLKGSTYKRKASKSERSKSSPTYKDLDFMEHHPEGIFLEADTYSALVKTIQRDCRVLESFKIMDYSLLVGIHNLDQAAREKAQEQRLSASAEEEVGEFGGESAGFVQAERGREREDRIGASALNRSRSINRQRLVAHSTAMESIQAESEPIDEEDDVPPGGIPARNARGERLLLFLGVIDILQSYRLKKKLEHTWKSMIHDGDTVSVHRPGFYAQRFQDFMAKTVFKKIPSPLKHSPSKRKSITRPLRPLDGDFDSTAVPTTGTSTMHATSPTKADVAISTTSTIMSTGSAPIATSTPVNFASGPVSPPPLTLSAGPSSPHQETPAPVTTSGAKIASYPAVLKGRTAASPPNPNLVPSGKIPPPVPPRGGQPKTARSSEEHRGPGTVTSTSSMSSSRGDEAAIITRYRLHESSKSIPHQLPAPDYISTSTTTAAPADTIINYTTRTSSSLLTSSGTITTTTTTTTTLTTITANNIITTANSYSNNATSTAVSTSELHARTSTPVYLPPRYDSLALRDRSEDVARALMPVREERTRRQWDEWQMDDMYDEEEFVSVEQNEDGSYVIKTSPYPFRPERGNFARARERSTNREVVPTRDEQKVSSRAEIMAKFTYFLNPASRPELMNYKMSRKDKKHSETYYERMKRKQKELEASITTITLAQRSTTDDRERIESSKANKSMTTISRQERVVEKKIDVQKLMERRKDSKILRKIREKSDRRKKKLAPESSLKVRPFAGPTKMDDVTNVQKKKIEIQKIPSLEPNYEDKNTERLTKSTSDVTMLEKKENRIVLKGEKRTFLVTKVDEEVPIKFRSIEVVYSSRFDVKDNIDGNRAKKKSTASEKIDINRMNGETSNSQSKKQLTKTRNVKSNVLKSLPDKLKDEFLERPSNTLIPNASFLHDRERSKSKKL